MTNDQCDFCGRLLPDQEPAGNRGPNENVYCSLGCCQAHELENLLATEGIADEEEPLEVPVGVCQERFDMAQLAAA